jgi:uncharacterized protein (DUF927 family)
MVSRGVASQARIIVELSRNGLPVTSNNAPLVVQYLADFDTENREKLPVTSITQRMGFQGEDGELGFLWGKRLIGGNQRGGGASVQFRGADAGDDQLAASLHSAGTLEEWLKRIQVIREYPRLQLALIASLAPPVLGILRASNIVLDYASETTQGKTTTLRVGASVWGNPGENSSNGKPSFLGTWNATQVYKERAPALLNHMPFILDDTKNLRNPDEVAKTIYAVVEGQGRGRGTVKGIAPTGRFTTVLISSGEQPATSFTSDGGTRGRVLTVWGSPFGGSNPKLGQTARELSRNVKTHYGHAGPLFVKY